MPKILLILGAFNAFVGVALGAFGAHGLRARLSPERLEVWQTAVQYQLVHALGLLLVGVVVLQLGQDGMLRWSGWLMFGGVVLFSGSLYLLCLTGVRWLGMVTPLGGLLFLAAWVAFALGVGRAA